jgi:hypothetical protein
MVQNNEGRACDAVVKLLESRSGHMRSDVWLPEKEGIAPLVDLRFRLGPRLYAIEHTRIETFHGQIQASVDFRQFIGPVIDELSGELPKPGIYNLYFPLPHRLGVAANQLEKVRRDFIVSRSRQPSLVARLATRVYGIELRRFPERSGSYMQQEMQHHGDHPKEDVDNPPPVCCASAGR